MMPSFDFNARPFIIIWEVTRACALACRHCRASAELRRHPAELNFEQSLNLLDQIERCRPQTFVLTGGDPVRRPDLLPLIRYAHGKRIRVGLTPSATPDLLAQDFETIKNAGVARMALSLDGASRTTHDAFRGVPGTWDWTMEAIRRARQVDLEIQINTTFTRQNLPEWDAFVELMDKIRPALWSVFQLVPTGRGKTDDLLSSEEMEELFLRLYRHSLTAPYDIKTTEGHHYRRVVLQQSRDVSRLKGRAPLGINDGKGFVFVSHTGDIFPSGFLPVPAGNVKQDELLDVYRNHPQFQALRDPARLKGKCGRCEYKSICGGSRARSFAMTGDLFAEEPLCSYVPRREAVPA